MIYLDYAATTYISESVMKDIEEQLHECYDCLGNPSNLYDIGLQQKQKIERSREKIANALKCKSNEIFFTSGASEGNAWALTQGTKCLCSPYEHHNITNNPKSIKVDEDYLDRCLKASWELKSYYKNNFKKYVYSHMLVNNETGEIFDIAHNFEQAKKLGMFTHCDMTQALGNVLIDFSKDKFKNIDMATFSGHKIHTPKGIGFAFIKESVQNKVIPLIYGGGQENGLRAGTENVPYIVALGTAVNEAVHNIKGKWEYCKHLRELVLNRLNESDVDYLVNEGAENIPSTLNLSFKNVEGEYIMLTLNEKNIYIGTGSACNTGNMEPSEVLSEMKVPDEYINGSIRLSFSAETTENEVLVATDEIINACKMANPN